MISYENWLSIHHFDPWMLWMVTKVLLSYLACCYVIAREFWEVANKYLFMQNMTKCCGWLPWRCYAVARVAKVMLWYSACCYVVSWEFWEATNTSLFMQNMTMCYGWLLWRCCAVVRVAYCRRLPRCLKVVSQVFGVIYSMLQVAK